MHAINFLYWFLGAIEAGQISEIKKDSNIAMLVLEHIGLVEELDEYYDSNNKNSLDMVYQIKGLLTYSDISSDNINKIGSKIDKIIKEYHNGPRTATAYFLQGAYELADINYVRVYPSMFTGFPKSDLLEKLNFLFEINGQSYLNFQMTQNLKTYVDNIFIHVINKDKVDSIQEQADTNPLPNGGRLKPVNKPNFPGETKRLEFMC